MTSSRPGRLPAGHTMKLNSPHEPELDPPFEVVEPVRLTCPLVFSSPHSGMSILAGFLKRQGSKRPAATARADGGKTHLHCRDLCSAAVDGLGAPLDFLQSPGVMFPRARLLILSGLWNNPFQSQNLMAIITAKKVTRACSMDRCRRLLLEPRASPVGVTPAEAWEQTARVVIVRRTLPWHTVPTQSTKQRFSSRAS